MGATGRCACEAVTYAVDGPLADVIDCHCHRCRRITGHHMAATSAARDRVRVDGAEAVSWWAPDASARYGFCRHCGSTLFWVAAATPDELTIAAGTLDPPTGLRTTSAWWVAEASDYHERPAVTEYPYEP